MSSDKEESKNPQDSKKLEEEKKAQEKEAVKQKQEAEKREKEQKEKSKIKEKEMQTKAKREPYKMPFSIRILNLILGLGFVIASLWAIGQGSDAIDVVVLVLAIVLTVSGILRALNAFYGKNLSGNARLVRFIIGIALIITAFLLYFDFGFSDFILFVILSFGLLLQGFDRIIVGLRHHGYSSIVKLLQLALGVILVIISLAAMIPSLMQINLTVDVLLIIVVGFFVNGLSRIISGLYGLQDWRVKK